MTLDNWTGKLKIKLVSLPANSKFTLGVAKLEDIVKAKGIYPLKEQTKIFFIDTSGATQNHQYNHIVSIKNGDQMFAVVKKANLKIIANGDQCCYHLNQKEKLCIFFSMEGLCEIDMVYLYMKE